MIEKRKVGRPKKEPTKIITFRVRLKDELLIRTIVKNAKQKL